MNYKKQIVGIIFFFTIIIVLSSCVFSPHDKFYVIDKYGDEGKYKLTRFSGNTLKYLTIENNFNNKLLDEYRINDAIVIFSLNYGEIYLHEKKDKNLARNSWDIRVYRKKDSNIQYCINKITLKTSDYEKDLSVSLYGRNSDEFTGKLSAFDSVSFSKDYELSMIMDGIFPTDGEMYPLPKDKKVNIIVDIDIMHDNGYENGIFMYSYEIKKEREWWDWIEV
jgi:hypothetical protein